MKNNEENFSIVDLAAMAKECLDDGCADYAEGLKIILKASETLLSVYETKAKAAIEGGQYNQVSDILNTCTDIRHSIEDLRSDVHTVDGMLTKQPHILTGYILNGERHECKVWKKMLVAALSNIHAIDSETFRQTMFDSAFYEGRVKKFDCCENFGADKRPKNMLIPGTESDPIYVYNRQSVDDMIRLLSDFVELFNAKLVESKRISFRITYTDDTEDGRKEDDVASGT